MDSVILAGRDGTLRSEVGGLLRELGYRVFTAPRLQAALDAGRRRDGAVLLVADRLEDARAGELVQALRADPSTENLPVVVLGDQPDEVDRIVALELGADEFLPHPANARELGLRLSALLRRTRPAPRPERERYGPIEIQRAEHRVWVDGKPVQISAGELRVLLALVSPVGVVHSREQIRGLLEDGRRGEDSRFIDARVARLRERLGSAGRLIETVRSVGYRLVLP